jgi:hypothetical protein
MFGPRVCSQTKFAREKKVHNAENTHTTAKKRTRLPDFDAEWRVFEKPNSPKTNAMHPPTTSP